MRYALKGVIIFFIIICNALIVCGNSEAARHVRVGYFIQPGYHNKDADGNFSGYGYEFLEKLRFYNDWEYEFITYEGKFSEVLQDLEDGRIDIVTSIIKSPERLEKFAFSNKPIGVSETVLTCKSGNNQIEAGNYETYDGATIGFLYNSSRDVSLKNFARDNNFSYNTVYYYQSSDLEAALQCGEVDMICTNNLRLLGNEHVLDVFDTKPFFLVTRSEDIELMQEADYAMSRIYTDAPRALIDLWDKYYHKPFEADIHLQKNEASYLEELKNQDKKLKVLFVPGHMPHSYYENGRMEGSLIQYFEMLMAKLELPYEIVAAKDVDDFRRYLKGNDIDIVVGLPHDYSKAERLGYIITDSVLNVSLAMVLLKDTPQIDKLAINEFGSANYVWGDALGNYGGEIKKYRTNLAGIEAVKKGECDAFVIDIYGAQLIKSKNLDMNFVIHPIPETVTACIGINDKLDRRFVNIINKAIGSMGRNGAESMIMQEMTFLSKDNSLKAMIHSNPEFFVLFVCMFIVLIVFGVLYHLRQHHINIVQKQNDELEQLTRKQQSLNKELQASYEQQRAQNEELTALNANLEETQQQVMESSRAKTTFLFNMSHDIRTPMNAIMGFAALLEKHLDDRKKSMEYLDKIRSSSNFLLSLINNVLDLARIESGKATLDESIVNLNEFGGMIQAVFDEQMKERGLEFCCEMNTIHKKGFCDELKLKQIFLNILSNAMKYTPCGGRITLKIEEIPCDIPEHCTFVTTISDTGIGMSEEYLKHLYEDFSRERTSTESKVAGTGLGMPIVKKLVDLMGGTIYVESKLGKGTTFTVTLTHRYTDGDGEDDNTGNDMMYIEALEGKRLLIAEDNDFNAEIAQELLEDCGFLTERAVDGVECVHMLEQADACYYDAVLMDVQMPNMDGYRATRRIREMQNAKKASIPIIAMTANAFEEDKRNAFAAGMDEHIAKPIDIGILLGALVKHIKY